MKFVIERFNERKNGERRRIYADNSGEATVIEPFTFLFDDLPLFSVHFLEKSSGVCAYMLSDDSFVGAGGSESGNDIVVENLMAAALRKFSNDATATQTELRRLLCADNDESLKSIIESNYAWCETQGLRIPYGAAVYRSVSCLNHACEPNAMLVFGREQIARVISVRRIEPGEEITISYVDFGHNDCHAKWKRGQSPLPFDCWCEKCEKVRELEVSGGGGSGGGVYEFETMSGTKERLFTLLLHRVQEEMNSTNNYERHYKMLRLLMSQGEPWKRFSRNEKMGPAVLHLGLLGFKAALQSVNSHDWLNDAHFLPFVKEWSIIFASAKCNPAPHLMIQQRFGVLWCNLVHKMCRVTDVHSTKQFGVRQEEGDALFASFPSLPQSKQRSLLRDFALAFRAFLTQSTETVFCGLEESEFFRTFEFYCAVLNVPALWVLSKKLIFDPAQERC